MFPIGVATSSLIDSNLTLSVAVPSAATSDGVMRCTSVIVVVRFMSPAPGMPLIAMLDSCTVR